MKGLILLIGAICLAEFSFSQTDYRKGYVITNARDTLVGLVDFREGAKAYKYCDYKSSKTQNAVSYEPTDIIGYGFENDKIFQSKEITIKDQSPKVVFLEVIVRGLVSLYKFENTFFIEKNNTGLQQLPIEIKEILVAGKRVRTNTNKHVRTLNMLLFDCAELREKVQKAKLNENALSNLIEDYNRCKGELSITFKAKKPWTKAILGVTGGVNVSRLNFDAFPGYEHLAGVFEISKSPIIGISFDFLSPRLSERISFHGDVLYLSSKYYNNSLFNTPTIIRNYVTIELQQLKVPIGIRYTFPKRNFTPYFKIGISSTIHLNSSSNWIQEVELNNVVDTYINDAPAITENQLGLFWGGFGILKSIHSKINAFAELRYEQTKGISQRTIEQYRISNFQILIGIRTK